jgi:hypothetical protein
LASAGRQGHLVFPFDDRVEAAVRQGVTAKQTPDGHEAAAQGAIAVDGFDGIFGATWHVAAGGRKHGRNGPLVGSQKLQRDEFGGVWHESGFGLRVASFAIGLSYYCEGTGNFVHDGSELGREQRLFGIDDDVEIWHDRRPRKTDGFAQATPHAIADDGSAMGAADRETDAAARNRTGGGAGLRLALKIENGHGRRKMAAAVLVDAFEVGMAQKARAAGKAGWLIAHFTASRFRPAQFNTSPFKTAALKIQVRLTFGSNGAHRCGNFLLFTRNAEQRVRAKKLFAEAWFHGDPLAPLSAAAG